ncbi:DUF2278 family protein [Kitasatospora sp. NPDC005856]|uniref:DUF2278 family protein n=1 Tax=Kitasatospora sp. NPDC005856 TaxID=3154566 RepID=UPI0034068628
MSLRNYGVLAGRALTRQREGSDEYPPYYYIHIVDDGGNSYRASVNVRSSQSSGLQYKVIDRVEPSRLPPLPPARSGWQPLASQPNTGALDLVRSGLLDGATVLWTDPAVLPHANEASESEAEVEAATEPHIRLAERLDDIVDRAIGDPKASVFVFGERWGPESKPDRVFGFTPGNGVHDIHMNQGNSRKFRADDGAWQDGGLLFHLPGESRWAAVFLAFDSQSWSTDDDTGHALATAPQPPPTPPPGPPQLPSDRVDWLADTPASEDRLQRRHLARTIATQMHRFRKKEPGTSLRLHIDGAWGAGKTTLIGLLQEELSKQEEGTWVPVEFDAWRQSRVGPAWWALLVTLRRSVAACCPSLVTRLRLRLSESWMRLRRTGVRFGFASVLLLLVSVTVFLVLGGTLASTAKTVTAVTAALGTLWAGCLVAGRFLLWDSASGARLFERANTNPMHEIADHFTWLVTRAPGPVVFFIDDLDRCADSYVVELLDAVQTLVRRAPWHTKDQAPTGSVSFVVAADGNWIRRSYEVAYANFTESVAEPGRPLGYLFLDKLFELRVPVPSIDTPRKQAYLAHLLSVGDRSVHLRAETRRTREILNSASTATEVFEALGDSSPEVRDHVLGVALDRLAAPAVEAATEHRLQRFEPVLPPNPRSMKLFVLAFNVLLAVRAVEGRPVHFDPLALWTVIETRWPLLADHLRARPESITLISTPGAALDTVPVDLRPLFEDRDVLRLAAFDVGEPLTPELIRTCSGVASEPQPGD